MRAALILLAVLAVAGCREASPKPDAPLPDPLAEATLACTRDGGRMVNAGIANAKVCIHETRDSAKQCRKSGDCEGDCLARSGTCAPVRPLFGCHEILLDQGQRAVLCRD